MSIERIQVESPDPILARAALDGQTVARIAHVNYVVDQINEASEYFMMGFNIINSADGSNTPELVGTAYQTSGSGVGGCRAGTQPYTYSNGTTGCINATLRTMYGNYLPVVTKTGVGAYTFTLPQAPLGYDILMSPPSQLIGTRVKLTKVSSTVFTINTQDASGGAADDLLTDMYLEMKIYN